MWKAVVWLLENEKKFVCLFALVLYKLSKNMDYENAITVYYFVCQNATTGDNERSV